MVLSLRKVIVKSLGLLLTILSMNVTGATKIFQNEGNNIFIFRYDISNDLNYNTNNFFIREIARYNLSSPSATNIKLHYYLNQSIEKRGKSKFLVSTLIRGEECSGDVFYRDFDISDILMPEYLKIKLSLYSGNTFVDEFEFDSIPLENESDFKFDFVFIADDGQDDYSIKIDDLQFFSRKNDEVVFTDRIRSIDEYYAGVAVTERLLDEITGMDITNPALIPQYLVKLEDAGRVYSILSEKTFPPEMNINTHDRKGYYAKLDNLKREIIIHNDLLELLSENVNVDFQREIPAIAKNYVETVSRYFELSGEVTHWYSALYYQLGLIDYEKGEMLSYFTSLNNLIGGNPDTGDDFIEVLQQEIFDGYLLKAAGFIEDNNFNPAIGLLKNAEKFHKYFLGDDLSLEFCQMKSKANYGIFLSYLQVAGRAIQVGNYQLAESYLMKAGNFQKENRSTIITNKAVETSLKKLIDKYIEKGNLLIENDNFKDAKYCFEQANRLSGYLTGYYKTYEIKLGMDKSRNGIYKEYVEKARRYYKTGEYLKANEQLQKAQELYDESSTMYRTSDNKKQFATCSKPATKPIDELLRNSNGKALYDIQERMRNVIRRIELARKKIEPMPLFYFFSVKNNLALIDLRLKKSI